MPTVSTPAAIPSVIEDLLAERQSHVEAIAEIDATMSRVSDALGVPAAMEKPMAAPMKMPKMAAAPKKKRGKASKFGISANDFVLELVGSAKSATTQEINKHWKEAGRPGTADNPMSILTKLKKLKRTPAPAGGRGSKYTLA